MAYSSYNEYIVKNNLLLLIAIYAVNYLASNGFRLFSFLLSFKIVRLSEWVLSLLSLYNIISACKGAILPFLSSFEIPFSNMLFTPGPLTETLWRIYKFFTRELNKAPVKETPAPIIKETKDTVIEPEQRFVSLFLTNSFEPKKSPSVSLNGNDSNVHFKPSLFQEMLFANKNLQNKVSLESQVATSELQQLFSGATEQTASSLFSSTKPTTNTLFGTSLTTPSVGTSGVTASALVSTTTAAPTAPKLTYTPCLKPPLKPAIHRERLLWYLAPTAEVIEDFRIEQMMKYQKYWHIFNDRADYDKLTKILLEKIFVPLTNSIDEYNTLLASKNINVANCTPRTVALSMTVPHIGTPFNLSDIAAILSMEDYPSHEAKAYIVERLKELCGGNRMAAFRFTPKFAGMPTDSEIIMQTFKSYLSIKEPYAIPPLINHEGDVFKFILIYIKITPELSHWGLFEKEYK